MQRNSMLMSAAIIAAGTLTAAPLAHAAQDLIQNDQATIESASPLTDSMIIYRGQLSWRGEMIDGSVNLTFRFFTEAIGEGEVGSPVLAEQWGVSNGRIAVAFELDDPHYLEHGVWMEITVDGITLSPRQFIAAPGYSLITHGVNHLNAREAVKLNDLSAFDVETDTPAPERALDPVSRLRLRATTDQHLAHAGRADRPAPGGGFFRTITPPDGGEDYDRYYDNEDDEDGYGVHGLRNNHNDGWMLRGDDIVWTNNFVGVRVRNPTARLDVKGGARFRGNTTFNKQVTIDGSLGIGTSSAMSPLHVTGPTSNTSPTIFANHPETDTFTPAIRGTNTDSNFFGTGVEGRAAYIGVRGLGVASDGGGAQTGDRFGVHGSASASGVTNYGVFGQASGGTSHAVFADGNLTATGTKSFQIDHPLDPENKYLKHYCAEAPEPINFYSGNVVLDGSGSAWVQLPDYFDSINRDPRYTLTAIGAAMPNLHVAVEVIGNQFKIAGGRAGMSVSWRVEAVRNDRYVQTYGAPVEIEKAALDRGSYLHPELYGQPPEKGTHNLERKEAMNQTQQGTEE